MDSFEKAWSRIRQTAERLSAGSYTPSLDDARVIVWKIIREEHCETPPHDAMEYLAMELRELIGHYRGDGKRSKQGVFY